jgi:DNA-binding MarR family transcriptional regulator
MNVFAPPAGEVPVPQGCTHLRLRQLMRRLDQHYDLELARVGLRTTQYSLLSHIVKLGPMAPGALARAMKMQPSTLTRKLQPLVAAGWVQVGAGPDGRSRSVSCTPEGRAKRMEAQRRWKAAQLALNAQLGPARVADLHLLIDSCMAVLSSGPVAIAPVAAHA